MCHADLDVRWHNSGTGKNSQYFVLKRTRRVRQVGHGEGMGLRSLRDGGMRLLLPRTMHVTYAQTFNKPNHLHSRLMGAN